MIRDSLCKHGTIYPPMAVVALSLEPAAHGMTGYSGVLPCFHAVGRSKTGRYGPALADFLQLACGFAAFPLELGPEPLFPEPPRQARFTDYWRSRAGLMSCMRGRQKSSAVP